MRNRKLLQKIQKLQNEKQQLEEQLQQKKALLEALQKCASAELDLLTTIINDIGETASLREITERWALPSEPFPDVDAKTTEAVRNTLEQLLLTGLIEKGLSERITSGGWKTTVPPHKALASLMATRLTRLPMEFSVGEGRTMTTTDVESAAKEMILPPPNTPNNVEVCLMSLARFAAQVETSSSEALLGYLKMAGFDLIGEKETLAEMIMAKAITMIGWAGTWRENAFARLEISHKLASALAFTDCPEPTQAPWGAWSLVLPEGILGTIDVRRVWCLGDLPVVLLTKDPDRALGITWPTTDFTKDLTLGDKELFRQIAEPYGTAYAEQFFRTLPLIQNLVRGCCLALSDPNDWRKDYWFGKPSGSEIKKASKHKELPRGEKYVLGKPVQIDLRGELRDYVSTGKGSSPSVLFLVRGHWRRQAHGQGHLLRKTIWIEPHWKGPEDARVLLRPYQAPSPPPSTPSP